MMLITTKTSITKELDFNDKHNIESALSSTGRKIFGEIWGNKVKQQISNEPECDI